MLKMKSKSLELLIAVVESLLNSRLLTYQSADHRDILPVSPNPFLHGPLVSKETVVLRQWESERKIEFYHTCW